MIFKSSPLILDTQTSIPLIGDFIEFKNKKLGYEIFSKTRAPLELTQNLDLRVTNFKMDRKPMILIKINIHGITLFSITNDPILIWWYDL